MAKLNGGDWIPRKEGEFGALTGVWGTFLRVGANLSAYKWDETEVGGVLLAIQNYQKALKAREEVDSSDNITAKNKALKQAKAVMRAFANASVRFNPNVPDEVRSKLGIHIRDTVRTTVTRPETRVFLKSVTALGGFRVGIAFFDETLPASRAIPYGFNGCLLNYSYGDERLTDYELLTGSVLMTHSNFVLELPPDAERTFLSCAARWQNKKGELGPWSKIYHLAVT